MAYRMTAQPVKNGAGLVGMELMLEASRRLPKAPSGFVRSDCGELLREAARDSGYCIDAPDELPAGACYGFDLGDDFVTTADMPRTMPSQITVEREHG